MTVGDLLDVPSDAPIVVEIDGRPCKLRQVWAEREPGKALPVAFHMALHEEEYLSRGR